MENKHRHRKFFVIKTLKRCKFKPKCTKIRLADPLGELKRSPRPHAAIEGVLLLRRREGREREESGGRGRGERRERTGKEGIGREGRGEGRERMCPPP